ncbi:hypothetical protein [Kineococcus sp. SYSU DK005]|uniref:hypothetical protein n=1 Tax=Kineococcus sp. SYSU DK005 TaxID=3383126 RepID=UPI003D7EA48D
MGLHSGTTGSWRVRTARAAAAAVAAAALGVTGAGTAAAVPVPPGACHAPWFASTQLTNPQDPGFFARIDRNGDGVICIKDWRGPDPDPAIGFLAIDNNLRRG